MGEAGRKRKLRNEETTNVYKNSNRLTVAAALAAVPNGARKDAALKTAGPKRSAIAATVSLRLLGIMASGLPCEIAAG